MRKTPISDKQAVDLYSKYWESRSMADLQLSEIILNHEYLFDDMCLEGKSIVSGFVNYQVNFGDEWVEECDDHEIDLAARNWRFYVKRMPDKDTAGYTRGNERIIAIGSKYKNDLPTILHEMIHAHEINLAELYPFYREILILCLYKKLSEQIPDLYELIIAHTNELSGIRITKAGGDHGVLFFLKSLDIDLQMGYEFGTVCGYGRSKICGR